MNDFRRVPNPSPPLAWVGWIDSADERIGDDAPTQTIVGDMGVSRYLTAGRTGGLIVWACTAPERLWLRHDRP